MTEFSSLLKDAAGAPPRPLNMHAVRDRAARLGLGRWRLWVFGVIGLVGLGVPVGTSVLPAGDRPAHVETSDRKSGPIDETNIDSSPGTTDRAVAAKSGARMASGKPASAQDPGEMPASAPSQRPPAPGGGSGPSTESEGCQAWGNGEAIVVGFGLPPECTYTATVAGGYRTTTATWQLKIVRDGREIHLSGETHLPCGEVGTVQPGDVVTARPWSRSGASAPGVLEVGPAYHC